MKHPRLSTAAVLAAALAAASPLRAATDPFYTNLLRDGVHAYDRADYPAAERHLRLACFGMLEEPKELAACLVRLALAQDKAADPEGFRDTFRRLVELEERFQAYSQGSLAPEVRASLEQRVAVLIPAATLQGSPAVFRGLAARKAESQPAKPQGTRRVEPSGPAPAASPPVKPQGSGTAAQPIERPVSQTPQPPAAAAPATSASAIRPLSGEEREKLETARKLLGESGKAKDLKRAFQLAREVADAHAELIDAQHLAGEAAYRVSRWAEAASYLQRGGGPGDDQPERLFYLAVSLYESGDSQAAAAALRRSLPNLQKSPYVDSYAKKILGN
ncbi:MAG TPA: hypothetical protein VF756_11420 [Thermoanaerobaculia bacterium]